MPTCKPALLCTVMGLAALLIGAPVQAQQGLYLKLDGIPGEHTQAPYSGWSRVDSARWAVSATVGPSLKGDGGLQASKPQFTGFSWSQGADTTVPPLLGRLVSGEAIAQADLQWVVQGPTGPATLMQLRLGDNRVTGFELNNAEFTGTLDMTAWGFGFKPLLPTGGLGKQVSRGFDLLKQERRDALAGTFTGYQPKGTATPPAPQAPQGERIFLRSDDPALGGASTVLGYEKWSELSGLSWSASNTFQIGGGGGSRSGTAQPGELLWNQGLDLSVMGALGRILEGSAQKQLVVEFVREGAAGPVTFMQLAFTDAYFTQVGFEVADSEMDVSLGVAFGTVTQTVWALNANGTRGKSTSIGWDVTKNSLILGAKPVGPAAGFGAGGLDGTVAAIPEPQTALLLTAGLLLIARRRLRA